MTARLHGASGTIGCRMCRRRCRGQVIGLLPEELGDEAGQGRFGRHHAPGGVVGVPGERRAVGRPTGELAAGGSRPRSTGWSHGGPT